jgi:hypothetical protein
MIKNLGSGGGGGYHYFLGMLQKINIKKILWQTVNLLWSRKRIRAAASDAGTIKNDFHLFFFYFADSYLMVMV